MATLHQITTCDVVALCISLTILGKHTRYIICILGRGGGPFKRRGPIFVLLKMNCTWNLKIIDMIKFSGAARECVCA